MTSMPTAPVTLGAAAVLPLDETPALKLALGLALILELAGVVVVIVEASLDKLDNISLGILSTPLVTVTRTSVIVEKFCNKLLISPLRCSSDPSSNVLERERKRKLESESALSLTTVLLDVNDTTLLHVFRLAVNAPHVIFSLVLVVA